MYSKILVPLDGSVLSEQVLPYARYLARLFTAPIELIFATKVTSQEIPDKISLSIRQDGESYLQRIADSLTKDQRPEITVVSGRPAEVIIAQAEAKAGTLVAMATHGYSGLQRWVVGGVAQKVVQCVATPVVLVPARAEHAADRTIEFDKVIVPLDGSDLGEYILPHVTQLCQELGMELILVRAYVPNFPGSSIRMHEVSEIVRESADNYVQDKVRQLKEEGLQKVTCKVLRGVPAEQITDLARATPNSLIAMCTHRRRSLGGRCVLGSVTSAVVHSSQEPVLIIRGPENAN